MQSKLGELAAQLDAANSRIGQLEKVKINMQMGADDLQADLDRVGLGIFVKQVYSV